MTVIAYRTLRCLGLIAALATMLAGCPQVAPTAAPDPVPAATGPVAAPAPMPASARPSPISHKPAPPMSGPLPAQVVPQPVKLDYSCSVDSDCTIKNVGSCCGARPACVNKHSPTDPAAVRIACAKAGVRGSCAVGSFKHCGCQQGRCAPTDRAPVGGWLDDPPPPPDPVR